MIQISPETQLLSANIHRTMYVHWLYKLKISGYKYADCHHQLQEDRLPPKRFPHGEK